MLDKQKIVIVKSFKMDFEGLFEKFSFSFWCKRKFSKNQLTHFESEELWGKIKNSLQSFN